MNSKYRQVLADLLTEVKLAEKKLGRVQEKLPVGESRIKQALVAGKRELAKKYALEYEETKLQVKRSGGGNSCIINGNDNGADGYKGTIFAAGISLTGSS